MSGFLCAEIFFQLQICNSTTLTPPGPPGVSREAKSSTEFKFGSLVRFVQKTSEMTRKTLKNMVLCYFFEVSWF